MDVSFYITKLRILKSYLFNKIDGVEQPPLEDVYYKHQVAHEMREINKKEKVRPINGIYITDHAYDMAKERFSMNKESFAKLAEKAFRQGVKHSDSAGHLKKYIDKKFFVNKSANNIRIYGENIFIFSNKTLVTVFQIPNNLKRSAIKIQKPNK